MTKTEDPWNTVSRPTLPKANPDIRRLNRDEVIEAAQNLVAQKGRHNTEIAYKRLEAAVKELK